MGVRIYDAPKFWRAFTCLQPFYTEARNITMYTKGPPDSFPPKPSESTISLPPQTKVIADDKEADWPDIFTRPFASVTALTKEPYTNGWILRKFLHRCLKRETPSQVTSNNSQA